MVSSAVPDLSTYTGKKRPYPYLAVHDLYCTKRGQVEERTFTLGRLGGGGWKRSFVEDLMGRLPHGNGFACTEPCKCIDS